MKIKFSLVSLFVLFLLVTYKPAFADETRQNEFNPDSDWKEKITAYREVVKEKTSYNSYFTNEEKQLYDNYGYTSHDDWISQYDEKNNKTSELYFPVLFFGNNKVYVMYTSNIGYTFYKELGNNSSTEFIGYLHDPDKKPKDAIPVTSTEEYTILFSSSENSFTAYQYGKEVDSCEIPEDSVYCGHSFFEGYIIRTGSDVYAVNMFPIKNVTCIAHNVSYVLDSDYFYSTDRWSEPLFLMEDGTAKVYIGSIRVQEELDVEPDDPIFLYEPLNEGSYR